MARNRYPSPDTDKLQAKLSHALGKIDVGINGVVNSKNRDEAMQALNDVRRAGLAIRESFTLLKELRESEKRLRAAVNHWHEKAKERAVT